MRDPKPVFLDLARVLQIGRKIFDVICDFAGIRTTNRSDEELDKICSTFKHKIVRYENVYFIRIYGCIYGYNAERDVIFDPETMKDVLSMIIWDE